MIRIAILAAMLTGCAQLPLADSPVNSADWDTCVKLSERYSLAERAALRGSVEAARAAGVAYGISLIAESISFTTIAPYIAAGYAITSGINGAIEAQDTRRQIIKECLRDKGYKVY